ncbi:ABC transporter permease [Bacillus sp. AGMB 02131]|uniref:Cell division protein FtsX n=1 Tax=Peribacillus faecalis TaxID=2772559 RepID=A0A927CVB7_9BACI|nr:permease-like cell division protein FtsX [Peribacillus faecalis]MBD3108482.1 ABC transporter permease [Peribacillus faecalis]
MSINSILRHFRESFKSLGRNGWMTFASVSAVTVTLLLVGVFFILLMNMNNVASNIEDDVEVRVHLDVTATEENRLAVEEELKAIPEVNEVTFSSKEEELVIINESLGNAFTLFEQDNPLRDVYIVKTKTPEDVVKVAEKAEKLDFVESVKYGQGYVEKLFKIVDISRNIGLVLIIGLLFTAMFLISNTIKITIMARKSEIEIMRLVGATNSFIRWPFFLEGLWLGILGSIIPIALIATTYYQIYEYATPKMNIQFFELLSFNPFVYQVSGILLLMGALIGVWGSMMSVRKFLKI